MSVKKVIEEAKNKKKHEDIVDIAEVFSPPRITKLAQLVGLRPGLAMDLTTGWDFNLKEHRDLAEEYVRVVKPLLLIGSPECRMFSALQNLNKKNLGMKSELIMQAKAHIRFVVQLYRIQMESGRLFLHEHPCGATSWQLAEIQDIMKKDGVVTTLADQCMYGLKTWSTNRKILDTPAQKKTRFMTNSEDIAEELKRKCDRSHAHQALMDGRAKGAAIYPRGLCEAVCRGVKKEKQRRVQQLRCLMTVTADTKIDPDEDHEVETMAARAWDDVSGEELDAKKVMRARLKELAFVREKGVWRKVRRAEVKARGIKVIGARWIDINKGDNVKDNYRSRYVAKEFNDGKDDSLFASTPPLEALRLIISEAATIDYDQEEIHKVIMINDVARAFFEAEATREVYVELPEEALEGNEAKSEWVAGLDKSLYGTRDAAVNFQLGCKKYFSSIGSSAGRYNASTYYHSGRQLRMMLHGDDFATVGDVKQIEWLKKKLEERFEIKTNILGKKYEHEGRLLGRVLRVTENGWEYEADQRHVDYLVRALNLQDANDVNTPQEESKPWLAKEEEVPLDEGKAWEYRSLVARGNYLASDRIDIQYAVKELCRNMSKPTVGDRRKLKRLVRYLKGSPRLVSQFQFQQRLQELDGYSDSDWAGCKVTAKSTSGGVITLGAHTIKTWSTTQKSITLSSAEAELVAAVKMAAELIGVTQLMGDWGLKLRGRVHVDSAAAIGVVGRKGNGKLRHVRVGSLWIQERVERGELEMQKVWGEWNPADLLTKGIARVNVERFVSLANQRWEEGRAGVSLQLKSA